MNNVRKNRTGLRLLGSVKGDYRRFTMNKTQQNQPVYSNIQPRCPGNKGKRGGKDCAGSNTNVGCQICYGCTYTFDVSKNAFGGAYPSHGSFTNVNLIVDSSTNEPCEWQYNAIVESFLLNGQNAKITLNIENEKCINPASIKGVYFYAPVGGNGVYTGVYKSCVDVDISSNYPIVSVTQNGPYPNNAKRMGAPYRNPIAGWRNSLNCNYKDCSGGTWTKQPTNNIYKDTYSGGKGGGSCAKDCSNSIVHRPGIQGRTHKPIIRSGMQEKRPCCKDSNGKCNKKNDYSFSYQQYLNNSRCMSYERSLEKYVEHNSNGCGIDNNGKKYCKNSYRKSSCCDCDCGNCSQLIRNGNTGVFTYADIDTVTIQATDCDNLFQQGGGGIVFSGPNSGNYSLSQRTMDIFTILSESLRLPGNCSNKAEAKTIYKPNNKKFSKQGAVSSGSRLDRLKLDTIRASNSRCVKGKRCKEIKSKFIDGGTYKVPNGKYDAGKPRFTGWMFNGHHQEVKGRVYNMVRYNQQPLGIPQLTAHPPGKTCIKQCFPRTLNLGRPTAAGNRARIPGAKCITNGLNCNCVGCNNNSNYTNQGVPCCKQ